MLFRSLLEQGEVYKCLKGGVEVSELFWKEARKFFERFSDALLPVLNSDGQILGFAFNDVQNYDYIEKKLS